MYFITFAWMICSLVLLKTMHCIANYDVIYNFIYQNKAGEILGSYDNSIDSCAVIISEHNDHVIEFEKILYSTVNDDLYYRKIKSNTSVVEIINDVVNMTIDGCTVYNMLHTLPHIHLANLFSHTHHPVVLISSNTFNHTTFWRNNITCSYPHHVLITTIKQLAKFIATDIISIIMEDDTCTNEFAIILRDELQKDHQQATVEINAITFKNISHKVDTLLKSIQHNYKNRRVYVMLTPAEITSVFFQRSKYLGMNKYYDIWICQHHNYNTTSLPSLVMTYQSTKTLLWRPKQKFDWLKYKSVKDVNIYHTVSYKSSFNSTAIQNNTQSAYVKLWWQKKWIQLYAIEVHNRLISILPQVEHIGILGPIGVTTSTNIKVVSILDGPFLYEGDYLLDNNKTACEGDSIICQLPYKVNNETRWNNTCCYGYVVDLLSELHKLLKFNFDLYLVEDNKYGGYVSTTKTFNGLIGDVLQKKASMAMAGLTINEIRSNVVDFTTPIMRSEIGIATKKNEKTIEYVNTNFIRNLGRDAAYAVGVFYILAIVIIWLLENVTLNQIKMYDEKYRSRKSIFGYIWQEAFTYTSGLLFQREIGGENPSTHGGQATAIFFAFGMVAITTMYTASLTVELVTTQNKDEFLGLKDPRITQLDESYKFGTTKFTSIETFFKNASNPELNQLYMFMKKYNVDTFSEGMQQLLDGQLQAFLHEYPFLQNHIASKSDCKIELHENPVGQTYYGIAVEKNSYLKDTLSEAILFLHEDGFMHTIQKKWISSQCNDVLEENAQFSLEFFTTPLLLVLLVMFISGGLLVFEIMFWKRHLKQRKQKHYMHEGKDKSFRSSYYKRRTRSSVTSMF